MKTPLRIAILECDTPLPSVLEKYGRYDRIFTALLETAAEGLGLTPEKDLVLSGFDVVDKQEYPNLEDIDAVLLTGSSMYIHEVLVSLLTLTEHDSFESDPWILKLVEFTEKVLKQDSIRIIGVCFGHQILGRALGVKVGRSDNGWEISVLPVELSSKGKEIFQQDTLVCQFYLPLYPSNKTQAIHQMHKDIVHTYPPGVEKLGASPRCLVQGMYKKDAFISVQGHPEFTEGIMIELVKTRNQQGIFDDTQSKDALARSGEHHDGVVIAKAFLRFLLED
jgi:GMP synthase-like glutamine amidotransferase